MDDSDVIKFNQGFILLEDLKEQIIIAFHYDFSKVVNPEKRILLNVFRKENLTEKLEANFQIKSNATLLVNYSTPEYAYSFDLTVNRFKKSVLVRLKNNPNSGIEFITEEEKKGLEFFYSKTS